MYRIIERVSLKNIRTNAEKIKAYAGGKLIAVVKDDAYGHGAECVCRALFSIADMFAVSSVEEGAALRAAGVAQDILVLTPCLSVEEGVRLISYNLIASVSSFAAFNMLLRAEQVAGEHVRAHLVVNTGMNRYGVRPSLFCRLAETVGERTEGLYSHFYIPHEEAARKAQEEVFLNSCETVKKIAPDALCHIAATGGALAHAGGEAVRAGIALYGYLPQGFEGALSVKPAAKFYAAVSHSAVPFGEGAGYAKAPERFSSLYTLRLGYGDGFFRAGGLNAIGKLCMDASIREGKARFSSRRLILSNVSAYAKELGTTEYEVLVRLGARAEKIYYG